MATCKACDQALVFRPDGEEDGHGASSNDNAHATEYPDDLELSCGCHFHWECLMDEASAMSVALKCPGCEAYLPSNSPGPSVTNPFRGSSQAVISYTYSSEGGVQHGADLLPTITEEAYLQNNPDARRSRAFQIMCSEGDLSGMVELLDEVNEDGLDPSSVVQYQDPLADMGGCLHVAVRRKQVEASFMLLWLCSRIPDEAFPLAAREAAQAIGASRISNTVGCDVRDIRDSQGRTAVELAYQMQGELIGEEPTEAWSSFLATASTTP